MPIFSFEDWSPEISADCWIAPTAAVIGRVVLGRSASVWFNAVIRADNSEIAVGARSNVQDGAMIHSDADAPCRIGEDCTVGHHAILHGCTIGDRVLVGMRATVLDRASIGDDCLIGAGALVAHDTHFPPGYLIVGVPATARRPLTDAELVSLREGAAHYVKRAAAFAVSSRQASP